MGGKIKLSFVNSWSEMCLEAKTKTQTGGGEMTDRGNPKPYNANAWKHQTDKKTGYYKHVFLLLLNMEGGKDSINHIKLLVLSMLLQAMILGTPPSLFPKILEMENHHLWGKPAVATSSSKSVHQLNFRLLNTGVN